MSMICTSWLSTICRWEEYARSRDRLVWDGVNRIGEVDGGVVFGGVLGRGRTGTTGRESEGVG
jgi:hypothetical protein